VRRGEMRVSRVEKGRAGVCPVCIVFEGLGPGPRVEFRKRNIRWLSKAS